MSSAVIDPPRPEALPSPAGRAWSRAGAIASVLASAPANQALRFSARVVLVVLGSIGIAVAVSLLLWTGLGPGPLDVFIGAVRVRSGLPLGVTVWLVVGSMVAAAWLLGHRPGPGTLVSPFIIGAVMQFAVDALDTVDRPESLAVRVVIHLVAIAGIGIGAGALIVSRLGAGSGELLATAASRRAGYRESRVRTAIEAAWLLTGVALGGPFGLGTLLVAATIGPAVVIGHRMVDSMVDRSVGSRPSLHVADCCDGKQ